MDLNSKGEKMKRLYGCIFLGVFLALFTVPAYAEEANLKFAVISDVRADTLDRALEFIASRQVEFIIVPGDYYSHQKYYPHFEKFGFGMAPEGAPDNQRVYFALGNHDEPPLGESVFQKTISTWYPKNGPAGAPQGTVFSFNRGGCHFVITNPYWKNPEGGYVPEQLAWIEEDLAGSNNPFKFVVGHEPAFPQKRHIGDSLDMDPVMRDRFWDILAENGAKAFFCGHTHHLSHLLYKDVYQIDAGQVRRGDLCITIVEVKADKAMVSSYKTDGEKPGPEDRVCQTTIDAAMDSENNTI